MLLAVLAAGCASAPPRVQPIPGDASMAFAEARMLARGEDGSSSAARAAESALTLAPGWVAPQRFLDELLRTDLLGPSVLEAWRSRAQEAPDDARAAYHAGRFEGVDADHRFRRAVQLDPDMPWGHLGLAWAAALRRERSSAVRHGRRALARARDPFERTFFTQALARHLLGVKDHAGALALLESRIAEPDVTEAGRLELLVMLALFEMDAKDRQVQRRGGRRGLELIANEDLTEDEMRDLLRVDSLLRPPGMYNADAILALAARDGSGREKLRVELAYNSPLAMAELERFAQQDGTRLSGYELRPARFRAGQVRAAVDGWLADLPQLVLDASGIPLEPRLASVVHAARDLPAGDVRAATDSQIATLGDALIAAGWFQEANSLADLGLGVDGDAHALQTRATAGAGLLSAISRILRNTDRGKAVVPGTYLAEGEHEDRPLETLADLLEALAPLFARSHAFLGGETEVESVERSFFESSRVGYSFLGSLVHPGPRFSAQDQRLGRGVEGEPVSGLAAELLQLGRFALFGEFLGGGAPDATILRALLIEHRAGSHLGVPWSGTIVWCEGADLPGRTARQGAGIAGAALHEGYWIDIEGVREEHDAFDRLRRQFSGPDAERRIARALAVTGLALSGEPQRAPDGSRVSPRARIDSALGEANRVRLAMLVERGNDGELGRVSLDEVLQVTAIHEEGHLCDRTRFYPPNEHWLRLISFMASSGFSPRAVSQRLEYRAQLVALCESPDPRIALIEILAATEGGAGPTPHAAAYADLLQDYLVLFDRDLAKRPERWPDIDPERRLLHQLHRIAPEDLRELAGALARKKGLTRE